MSIVGNCKEKNCQAPVCFDDKCARHTIEYITQLKNNWQRQGEWAEPIAMAGVVGCLDAMEEENIRLRKALEVIKECESKGQARRIAIQALS